MNLSSEFFLKKKVLPKTEIFKKARA